MKREKEYKKLKKLIKKSKTIFFMNHKNLDLDAIGSSIGMYSIAEELKKECFIVVDDEEHEKGVGKVLKEIEGVYNVISSKDLPIYLNKKGKKNLLIILDTNKEEMLQNKNVLEYFEKIIIIDHHKLGKSTVEASLIIDEEISSTCEMVLEIANYYEKKFKPYVCTLLLAGIVLDTNNFTLKTDSNTFYSAYELTAYGASVKKVQYLLKQDIEEYNERQKLISNVDVKKGIAIAKASPYVIYRRDELARAADELLYFSDIDVSFVIGKIEKNVVAISARSLGNKDISEIMTRIKGGGDATSGAAIIKNKKISEVYDMITDALKGEK